MIHSKAFRRLKHKTQVFFAPEGDHYRTRLTHTLEVSQIARSIAKVLRLNEELTEAIALGHDLGHTPFGHAGERVLQSLVPGGFEHYEQSLRIVDVLEHNGQGLNLTWEVRDGIARHSKGKHGVPVGADPAHRASTIEGQIARVADIIAYVNHDIDDAVRAGLLRHEDLPRERTELLGNTSSQRIGTMVTDVVLRTLDGDLSEVRMSDAVLDATIGLRSFLFESVYENPVATAEFKKAAGILGGLWEKVRENPEGVPRPADHRERRSRCRHQGLRRRHDRPLRGQSLRAALHSEALGVGEPSQLQLLSFQPRSFQLQSSCSFRLRDSSRSFRLRRRSRSGGRSSEPADEQPAGGDSHAPQHQRRAGAQTGTERQRRRSRARTRGRRRRRCGCGS